MINATAPTPEANGQYARCLDSFWLDAPPRDVIGRALRATGMWEPQLTRWIMAHVERGSKCVDIGMNNGYFAELMARLSGDSGHVWAFEPRQNAVCRYREAQSLNSYEGVAPITVFQVALGNENKDVAVRTPANNEGASTTLERFHFPIAEPLAVITSILPMRRMESVLDVQPDIVKMDAEGSEPLIIDGFGAQMKRAQLIVTELHPSHSPEFIDQLRDCYDMRLLNGQPFTKRVVPFAHVETVQLRAR